MDWAALFAPISTGVQGTIEDVLPLGLGVLVTLASITIGLAIFRKVGIKR